MDCEAFESMRWLTGIKTFFDEGFALGYMNSHIEPKQKCGHSSFRS